MTQRFIATEFSATEEEWGYLTVLGAPSSDDEDFYLMLQRPYTYSEDSIRWDKNKPYIEFCGQGWSWYGHILSFKLLRDCVLVRMDEIAAKEMDTDGEIEVKFSLGENDFALLKQSLQKIFTGENYFEIC